MKWAVFLLVLVLPTLALADALHDGWYYSGDTFEVDDVVYSVEGSTSANVLLGVGGHSYLIPLAECVTNGQMQYCYVESAYPNDDDHTKYSAGEIYYGYFLSINELQPEVEIDRDIDEDNLALGETAEITVSFENTGEYTVNGLTYTEQIPAGLTLSGPRGPDGVLYTKKSLPLGTLDRFTYRLTPTAYGSYEITPNITYKYGSTVFSENLDPITIDVDSPITVVHKAPSSLNLEEQGTYSVNVTNDAQDDIDFTLTVTLPPGISATTLQGFKKGLNGSYTVTDTLNQDEKGTYSIGLRNDGATGTVSLPLTLKTTLSGEAVTQTYTDSITSHADIITPTLKLSSERVAYYPGTQLTVSGILKNENTGTSFRTISGTLSGDLFKTVAFDHAAFPASKTLTEAEAVITLPQVSSPENHTMTFSGSYVSPSGRIFEFSVTKTITITPRTELVQLERELEPKEPQKGENVTVTVYAKNTYGAYLTIDAHEKYDDKLAKAGGLTYASTSFEKDERKQLYVYQLQIPADYSSDRFNITTSVLAKGQPLPQEITTEVAIKGAAPKPNATQTEENTTQVKEVAPEQVVTEKKDLGFFASIWDFLKGLFD